MKYITQNMKKIACTSFNESNRFNGTRKMRTSALNFFTKSTNKKRTARVFGI